MIVTDLMIVATIVLIVDLALFAIGGYMVYSQIVPLIKRKLLQKDGLSEERVLKTLRQVARDYPESKKFMLILKQILITKRSD